MLKNAKFGLQIYSLGDLYLNKATLYEALKITKEAGYDAIEMLDDVIMEADELKKMLDDVGLECCGWHTPWDYLTKPDLLEMFISYNKIIGNKYLICKWLVGNYSENKETWLEGCAKMNEIAARLKKSGMYTGIHYADTAESSLKDTGERLYDVMAANTCDDFIMQLDTGNSFSRGTDPVAALKKHKNRYQTVHLKPYSPTKGHVPIGEDDTDWAEIAKYLDEYGNTEYIIIEHEVPNAATEVKTCLENFKKYL